MTHLQKNLLRGTPPDLTAQTMLEQSRVYDYGLLLFSNQDQQVWPEQQVLTSMP